MCAYVPSCISCLWLFTTLWTVASQASLSMESSRPEYWSQLLCPPPGGGLLEDAGLNPSILNCFHGNSAGKESTCNAGDPGSIPGSGRYTGEWIVYPLQYSGLEISMDRGAWQVIVHGVTKSWARLSNFHFHFFILHCRQIYIIWATWEAQRCIVIVQSLSHVWLFVTRWTAVCQASCPSLSPWTCSNSCPLSQWCHPTISSSVAPFSSWPQSFLTSGSFLMSRLFVSGSQNIGASA